MFHLSVGVSRLGGVGTAQDPRSFGTVDGDILLSVLYLCSMSKPLPGTGTIGASHGELTLCFSPNLFQDYMTFLSENAPPKVPWMHADHVKQWKMQGMQETFHQS